MPTPSYVAYFDECGDHGLTKIDPQFPVFALMAAVFEVKTYLRSDLKRFNKIKFKYFGHDAIVFHSHKIRKKVAPFNILVSPSVNRRFTSSISHFFEDSHVTLICAAIDKERHRKQYKYPDNPYDISLQFCLERLYGYLEDQGASDKSLTCVFESRGKKEDGQLARVFSEICGGANSWGKLQFSLHFASKQMNMIGLQIADLAAYPTARYIMDRKAKNPAFEAIEPRFRTSRWGKMIGWGLKIFP